MRKFFVSTATCWMITSAVLAGGLDPVSVAPVEVAAPAAAATDWSGFYLGGKVAVLNGNLENNFLASGDFASTALFGGFAGYNIQRGNLVFGAEVDFTISPITFVAFTNEIDNVIDAKARVGYAFGNALVFGMLGYSTMSLDVGGNIAPLSGLNYGIGVDVKIGDRYFIGAEYLVRSISGVFIDTPAVFFTDQINSTASIRAGFNF